jgi:hypothetical protein
MKILVKMHTSQSGVVLAPVLGPSVDLGRCCRTRTQHFMLVNMKEWFNEVKTMTFAMKSLPYFFYCKSGSEYDLFLIFCGWLKQTGVVN